MIAKLRGVLDGVGDGWAVVDVGGVGYLTYCSAGTLASMPARGQEVSLTIETVVREDHIHLYGFASEQERDWFRLLQTVQSVGARLALAILGALPAAELAACIAAQDRAGLTRAPGVGPKLAARILSELADKAPALPGAAPLAHDRRRHGKRRCDRSSRQPGLPPDRGPRCHLRRSAHARR